MNAFPSGARQIGVPRLRSSHQGTANHSTRDRTGWYEAPIVTLSDWQGDRRSRPLVRVRYERPVATIDWEGRRGTTLEDEVVLEPCPQPSTLDRFQQRELSDGNGVRITTAFYWQPADLPYHFLSRFVGTTITGLTAQPLELTGSYSQTYTATHHNRPEVFIFDPWLEPGLPMAQLDELLAKSIRLIVVYRGLREETKIIYLADDDGCLQSRAPRRPGGRLGF